MNEAAAIERALRAIDASLVMIWIALIAGIVTRGLR